MGFFDLPRAMMLSSQNGERAELLKLEAKALRKRARTLDDSYGRSLHKHFDKDLARFCAAFAQLRNAELDRGDLQLTSRIAVFGAFSPQTRDIAVEALRALVEQSRHPDPATGSPPTRLTLAAVRELAVARGEAAATPSGPYATRSALAWLGGTSPHIGGAGLAGGQARVSEVVVLPVAIGTGLWLARVGSRELVKQEKVAADMKKALSRLKRQRALVDQIEATVRRATKVLRRLAARLRRLLTWLESLLGQRDDVAGCTAHERHRLTTLATLATAMVAVMVCPVVIHVAGRKGKPVARTNGVFPLVLDAAEALLAGVPGGEPGDDAAGDAGLGDTDG